MKVSWLKCTLFYINIDRVPYHYIFTVKCIWFYPLSQNNGRTCFTLLHLSLVTNSRGLLVGWIIDVSAVGDFVHTCMHAAEFLFFYCSLHKWYIYYTLLKSYKYTCMFKTDRSTFHCMWQCAVGLLFIRFINVNFPNFVHFISLYL